MKGKESFSEAVNCNMSIEKKNLYPTTRKYFFNNFINFIFLQHITQITIIDNYTLNVN